MAGLLPSVRQYASLKNKDRLSQSQCNDQNQGPSLSLVHHPYASWFAGAVHAGRCTPEGWLYLSASPQEADGVFSGI